MPFRISRCNPSARTRCLGKLTIWVQPVHLALKVGFVLSSFFSSFWVRFQNAPCVFNNILASFVLFLCFSECCPPTRSPSSGAGKSASRKVQECPHRLPKLRPERWDRRLASQLLDSLTPRLLDCTWRQKPQAGTTNENRRGLSGMTLPAGPDPCSTPQNNCSLCRPVCQEKNAPSTRSPTQSRNRHAQALNGRRWAGAVAIKARYRVAFQPEIRRIIAPVTATAFQDISHSLRQLYPPLRMLDMHGG